MSKVVYPHGSIEIDVSDDITINTEGSAEIYFFNRSTNAVPSFSYNSTLNNDTITLTPGASISKVRIDAGAEKVYYLAGVNNPIVSVKKQNSIELLTPQGEPPLVTANIVIPPGSLKAGIIVTDASSSITLTLPLAVDLDAALPECGVDFSFDFSLINISSGPGDDAAIAINTGWTIKGPTLIFAFDTPQPTSFGRFRARKTGAGAWTLYRIG